MGADVRHIELKRRYNGTNNGRLILSHRDAAKALAVYRNTVGPWFDELTERGFICMMQAPHLGPSGIGQAAIWALDEMPTDDLKPARKAFMSWGEKQKPRTKNRTARHSICDTAAPEGRKTAVAVLKIVT